MKKIYFSVLTLMASLTIQAQQTIGFEGVQLASESYFNGSFGTGGFIEDVALFENYYDQDYFYWSGFSVSNITDITTAGYSNQYAAFTGIGGDNSTNYAVYASTGKVIFTENKGVHLSSIQVSNTTYAALSMRDGDAYAKQFGSANDANSVPDGTNGEDFFKLWIVALDADNARIDSVEVFLADYRFADNNEDYILDSWLTVDLSTITAPVYGLDFKLESSDNGDWGMNTPAYFALDNLTFNKNVGLNNADLEAKVSIYPNPFQGQLTIKGESGKIELFDASGNLIQSNDYVNYSVLNVEQLAQGSYILKISNEQGVLTKKLIK